MDNDPGIDNPFDEGGQNDSTSALDQTGTTPLDEEGDSSGRPLAWIFLGLAAIVCGLVFAGAFFFFQPDAQSLVDRYFPSPTVTNTRTPTRTPTPNLTATQRVLESTTTAQAIETLIADAGSQWNELLSDSFDNVGSSWITGTDDDVYATIVRRGVDRTYQWDATAKQGFVSWITANEEPLTDFYLSVEAERVRGSTSSDYGLVFREDENTNFYYFGVSDDGFFVSVNYDNEWIDVVEFTSTSVVASDAPNRITVIARGSHFIFLINDVIVAEAVDDHIPSGTTALAMQIHEEGLEVSIAFDNFDLRAPAPSATPTPTPNLTATQQVLSLGYTAGAFHSTATSIAREWKEVFVDNFDSSKGSWRTISSADQPDTSILKVEDGKYRWDITSDELDITWATANTRSLGDFVLSVDVKLFSGPDTAKYGIFFRENSTLHGYYFGINNKGEYFFDLYNGAWITLIDYTESEWILPKEDNRIAVNAEGSHFTFFVNDQYLAEYTDERIKKGGVGLFAILYEPNRKTVIEFDNFDVRAP